MKFTGPNHPASGKAEIAARLTFGHHRLGLPEPGRWEPESIHTRKDIFHHGHPTHIQHH
jgi:hypothetical protein